MYKRMKPYTSIGITRVKCFRCGNKACTQWQICSDGGQFRPLCKECDIALNALVLDFMNFPDKTQLMAKYIEEFDR